MQPQTSGEGPALVPWRPGQQSPTRYTEPTSCFPQPSGLKAGAGQALALPTGVQAGWVRVCQPLMAIPPASLPMFKTVLKPGTVGMG